jgi:exopolysaccharide biosynthesis polyprenyl glycosylphosphotransferase
MSLAETETLTAPVAPASPIEVEQLAPATPLRVAHERSPEWLLDGRGFVLACLLADLVALVTAALVVVGPARLLGGEALDLVVLPPLAILLLAVRGTYSRTIGSTALDAVARLVGAIAIAALGAVVIGENASADAGNAEVAVAAGVAALGVTLGRAALIATQRRARGRRLISRPTVIVGGGVVATRIARRLLDDPRYGLRPIGFVDDPDPRMQEGPGGLPLLGRLSQLADVASNAGARHVIVAFSETARDDKLSPLVRECERRGLTVSVVPRLFESINGRLAYERLGGLPLLGLRAVNPSGWRFAVKHAFDFGLTLFGLVVIAPLLAAIALAVRLESPGPILFRQRRVGRDGQVFDLLKFRSMRADPEPTDFVPAEGTAPGGVEGLDRRTRVGRFLRRTSLDELPQLLNVLRGEMSLVGPRPERPEFVELFARDIQRYDERHRVRSGLTGWAQVHGYRGQTSLTDRVEWDNYYIEHWSLGLDLKILLMTVGVVIQSVED